MEKNPNQDVKKNVNKKPFLKKEQVVNYYFYLISFLLIIVLTVIANYVFIKYNTNNSQTKIYSLNLKKLTNLKRTEIHREILQHPTKTTPEMIKSQITNFVKDVNNDTKKYETNGVIIVKQAIIGGKGYEDITGKIEENLKEQKVL
ncbi:MAG: hypothetical protein ACYDDE_07335 [bacterium]